MNRHTFATLAVSATLAGFGCGRAEEPPLCDSDLCVTSSSSQRAEARFDLDGVAGTARLEFTDTAIDVAINAGGRELLHASAVRATTHYEATMSFDGVSLDDAHAGKPEAIAALAAFMASADASVLRQVLDRLQQTLEPRGDTADLGQLSGVLQLAIDETDAYSHGGDVEYGPPSGSSCLICLYLDKGCFCISCTIPHDQS